MRHEATAVGDIAAARKETWHLNARGESRVLRFLFGFLMGSAGIHIVWVVVLLA